MYVLPPSFLPSIEYRSSKVQEANKYELTNLVDTDDWRHATKSSEDDPAVKPETFSNFFTDVRIHQIREMQEQVVVSEGIPSFDFGEMWEGWQSYQQMVHPLLVRFSFLLPIFRLALSYRSAVRLEGMES